MRKFERDIILVKKKNLKENIMICIIEMEGSNVFERKSEGQGERVQENNQ